MQLFAHSFFNNAGLFFLCNPTTNKKMLLKGKVLSRTIKKSPILYLCPKRPAQEETAGKREPSQTRTAELRSLPLQGRRKFKQQIQDFSIHFSLPAPS